MSTSALARDIIVSIGAAFTTGVAISGVYQWRTELKGRAKLDLATRLGKSASRFEALLNDLRTPIWGQWADKQTAAKSIKPLHETYVELMEGKWEAQILMSKGICDLIKSVAMDYGKLWVALNEHLDQLDNPDTGPSTPENLEEGRERRRWLYGSPGDDKEESLRKRVSQLTEALRKVIRSGSKTDFPILFRPRSGKVGQLKS